MTHVTPFSSNASRSTPQTLITPSSLPFPRSPPPPSAPPTPSSAPPSMSSAAPSTTSPPPTSGSLTATSTAGSAVPPCASAANSPPQESSTARSTSLVAASLAFVDARREKRRHLVEMLIRHKEYYIRIVDLEVNIVLELAEQLGLLGQALHSGRAQYVSLDFCNKAQVLKALEGVEVVFHMAAPNSSINNYQLHHSINVQGAHNVIDACMVLNVKHLIYTSCLVYPSFPSIFFDDVHGIHNGNETMPYVHSPNDHYSATKAEGEALVIKANGTNGLLTCYIRLSSIFGPGDRLSMSSLVAAARKGESKWC
eukprot:XP_006579094.1 3beta-hydroxysteroid-dehydrogenase/decarboxylase-like [Glycine max]